ncbi:MAG: hypothetical protein ACOVVK_11575 [Elsteraceae bacterium]
MPAPTQEQSPNDADASDGGQAADAPTPQGEAPTVQFNQTGIYEPADLERITMEVPREGTTYITFQRRFVVTGGSATRNMQMDFTFSSIVLRHSGSTPGNANVTVRMVDGRTVFLTARSTNKTGDDRFAFVR